MSDSEIVYHYCSVDAFNNIMHSKKIHLSSCNVMNDSTENRTLLKALQQLIDTIACNDSERRLFLQNVFDAYKKRWFLPYIACFSREKNSLYQWRTYGDDGLGVAIGIDVSKIPHLSVSDVTHKYGGIIPSDILVIDSVLYHTEESNYEWLEECLTDIMHRYTTSDLKEKILNDTNAALNLVSCFTKDFGFFDENEVRMLYDPSHPRHFAKSKSPLFSAEDLNFRVNSKKELIGFYDYTIPSDAFKSVILGPKCRINPSQLELFMLKCFKNDIGNITISSSKIPYV